MQWQSAHYAVILLQNLHRLPLGLQMRFWLLWLTMQGKQVHTNHGKYTAHTVATRQQMHTISNNNHTICYCSCHCTHTSVQQNYPCSSQSHLPCTAPFRVIQHDHSPCTEVEWCSTCCFSKPTTGTGRTSEGKFLMTAPLFLPSKGSEHNRGAARVGSEEYCRPHKKRRSCRAEVAKSGQDCLTLCAAAWD